MHHLGPKNNAQGALKLCLLHCDESTSPHRKSPALSHGRYVNVYIDGFSSNDDLHLQRGVPIKGIFW